MTTLIEDGSNRCQASGRAGMSDGGHDSSKKHWRSGWVSSAIGSGKSPEILRENSMSRSVQKSLTEKTKGVTNSILFQQSLELMSNLCTLGAGQRAIHPCIRRTAYCEMRMSLVARRAYSYTSVWELGKQLDVNSTGSSWCCCCRR